MAGTTIYKKCENCKAGCCSDAVSPVYFTPADVVRATPAALAGKTDAATGNFEFRLKKRGDGKCIFFRETTSSHCTIYDTRPECCRVYNVQRCTLRELE